MMKEEITLKEEECERDFAQECRLAVPKEKESHGLEPDCNPTSSGDLISPTLPYKEEYSPVEIKKEEKDEVYSPVEIKKEEEQECLPVESKEDVRSHSDQEGTSPASKLSEHVVML